MNEDSALKIVYADRAKQSPVMFLGRIQIPQEQAYGLCSEANAVLKLTLWDRLINDFKWQINEQMYLKSKTAEDMVFSKGSLWMLDVLEKKVQYMGRLQKNFTKKDLSNEKESSILNIVSG